MSKLPKQISKRETREEERNPKRKERED